MASLDLHPEELFDKAARGAASPDELARIDAHLASCGTCRFERQVRADFAAVGGEVNDLDDLVARALSGAAQHEVVVVAPRRRKWTPLLVATVALMGFASFAAAAQITGVLPLLVQQLTQPTPPAPTSTPAPRAPRPAAAAPEEVLPTPALVPEVETPAPSPVALVPAKTPARRMAVEPTPVVAAPETTPEIPPAPVAVAPAEPDALTLFGRARHERVEGQIAAAIRDFRVLVARYPKAPETALAHAELGRLLMDRGESASALEAFDAYLSSGDTTLREDVSGARAMALGALDRDDEERAAWEAVLRDYPEGLYAPRARQRLEQLAP